MVLNKNVCCCDRQGQCRAKLIRASYVYLQIAYFLPNAPVVFHLSDVYILDTVYIQADLRDSLVALGLLNVELKRFELVSILQTVDRSVVREFRLRLNVFKTRLTEWCFNHLIAL